jgi:hypothetical protein
MAEGGVRADDDLVGLSANHEALSLNWLHDLEYSRTTRVSGKIVREIDS